MKSWNYNSCHRFTNRNRVGRGNSFGNGKTSLAGQKGQKLVAVAVYAKLSRQRLFQRSPKRGFTNINAKEYIEPDQLNAFNRWC